MDHAGNVIGGENTVLDPRHISSLRAQELKQAADRYLHVKDGILSGLDDSEIALYEKNKAKLLAHFGAADSDWDDYKWQLSNRIDSVDSLGLVVNIPQRQREIIDGISKQYRWAISPYYAALIDSDDLLDPIRLLSVPSALENNEGEPDPMDEEFTNPAGVITRRYPDRLIMNITNVCASYCRHCQRKRYIGEHDRHCTKEQIDESVEYIRRNEEIRDVLITGGDPLTLSDSALESILKSIREIPHVEIIRLGTRVVANMPQRITDNLVNMLKRYHPIYVNAQFNHPREITPQAKEACEKLADAGIPLGNQAVLLNGVNNDKSIMCFLNQLLLSIRVRPYYIFHCKNIIGSRHFNTSIEDGLAIMEFLRGNTSGLAIPTYVLNVQGGLGKIPVLPQYIHSVKDGVIKGRTWENKEFVYPNSETVNLRDALHARPEKPFMAIILGTDMNAYAVARSFHEEYGIQSVCLGKKLLYYTKNSGILAPVIDPDMESEACLLRHLREVREAHRDKDLFVIPCGDTYVEPLVNNMEALKQDFILPLAPARLIHMLTHKDAFYAYCEKAGIDFPATTVCSENDYQTVDIPYSYPVVVKPANSADYWKCDFDGKKKAFTAESETEVREILSRIYSSSYRDKVIIQEFIPGDDSNMRMICSYSGKDGKTKRMTCLHLLLEEHSPTGIGSSAVSVLEANEELYRKVQRLLDDLHYVGFSNIDFKYDPRDGAFKIFDFNVRLPRSSYHMTAVGFNIAKLLVDDLIRDIPLELVCNQNEWVWSCVPAPIVKKYTRDVALLAKATDLKRRGKFSDSCRYNADMNLMRWFNLLRLDLKHFGNYKKYFNNRRLLDEA